MRQIGSQIWYGVSNDAKGFPGVKAFTIFGSSTLAGDNIVIDAEGTSASTASSIYAVKFGPQDIELIGGRSSAFELSEFTTQQIVAGNGGKITAYVADLTSWIGMQLVSENSARRIANVTEDAGKGATDALLAQLLATFPVGDFPDAIYMTRRSRSQLQTSRTVVLQGQGTNRPNQPNIAPLPTEYDGVRIYASDSILNTDAIES
jgi:hypothetical protein